MREDIMGSINQNKDLSSLGLK